MAIIRGRQQARPDKAFALFLIGMRVHSLLSVRQWWPVAMAMPRMQRELARKPDAGLLWLRNFQSGRVVLTLQYWESMEKLFAYAHDQEGEHFPAWAAFNRKVKDNPAVGIWHETYTITPDNCENIYRNMPAFGLGAAFGVTPATARMGGLRDPFAHGKPE
ncbi:MAG TPA: DUF4188 domain-containing protein [Rhizomicrobium sp.]|nr:DUF4188 domain-containing protein [Rhizomicrobium sp.]